MNVSSEAGIPACSGSVDFVTGVSGVLCSGSVDGSFDDFFKASVIEKLISTGWRSGSVKFCAKKFSSGMSSLKSVACVLSGTGFLVISSDCAVSLFSTLKPLILSMPISFRMMLSSSSVKFILSPRITKFLFVGPSKFVPPVKILFLISLLSFNSATLAITLAHCFLVSLIFSPPLIC